MNITRTITRVKLFHSSASRLRRIRAIALGVAFVACTKDRPTAPDASTAMVETGVPPDTSRVSAAEGRLLVKNSCLSCHSEEMLAQQRLSPAQWAKVVTKMASWGANLEPSQVEPLTAWLAATYGPEAGAYEPSTVSPTEAAAEIAPLPDGPFAGGDPERGHTLYTDKCSGCHGTEARGHIGVLLVDRPLLYRAADVATTIRRGRGKMTPIPMTDAEIADVLAHLRRLK